MIKIEQASAHGFHETGFAGAIWTMQNDDSRGKLVQIEAGDAAPVGNVNATEDHALTSLAIW